MSSLPIPLGTDTLTGLPLRAICAPRLEQQRGGAVLFVDLDAAALANVVLVFTTVDRLLVDLAALLKDIVPAGGFAGRWAGDKFIVYVPDASSAGAIAEQLRSAVEQRWCAEREELRVKADPVHHPLPAHMLTVSVGVAQHRGNAHQAVRAAEDACITAKRSGRNRVVVSDD